MPSSNSLFINSIFTGFIILGFVFVIQGPSKMSSKKNIQHSIKLYVADTAFIKRHPEIYSRFQKNLIPVRKYMTLNIVGEEAKDIRQLDIAKARISQIVSNSDTTAGVHFYFGKSASYGTFIKAIDILNLNGAKTYMVLDSDIWFYQFPTVQETVTPIYL